MMRSRLRTASRLLGGDTLRGLRHGRERAVASLGLVLDGAGALDVGARHFGAAMLEAFRHVDLDAMRHARDGILDGLHVADQDARNFEPRLAAALVESPLDRREDRIVHLRDDQAEDMEDGPLRRILAGEDAEERFALLRGGTLVEDRLDGAVPLV